MKNWEDDDDDEYCSTRQDLIDCASVADVIGIDLEVVNFAAEYKERVFSAFLREYSAGPHAQSRRAVQRRDQVQGVSRPRARARRAAHRHRALRAGARSRTAALRAAQGARTVARTRAISCTGSTRRSSRASVFPLGELKKTEVRRIAEKAGLPNFAKRDSTGICFIGERPFREFLNRYLPQRAGPDAHARGHGRRRAHRPCVLHHRPEQGHRHRRA